MRWAEVSKLLKSLPSKQLCDVLLQSFLLSVRHLLPLVHGPTLQAEFDDFWKDFSHDKNIAQPSDAVKHTSFYCLFLSVIYCGAVAASPELLAKASVHVKDNSTFLSRLRLKLNQMLTLCNYTELPTLNGLIASILAQECDPKVDEILAAPPFVSQCMQAARTLGLHREEAVAVRGEIEAELSRRVWYHIIQLEVLATISSGNSLSYSSSEESYNVRMPYEFNDASIGTGKLSLDVSAQVSQASTTMLLALGRYEMSRTLRHIVEKCYNNHAPTRETLGFLVACIEQLESKIDGFIARLEVRGLPEQGHISTQLLEANPLVHTHLYRDDPHEETVFNAFARIMLYMMKHYVAILFNRQFLNQASSQQTSRIWTK